jgi:hypothetical protein
MVINSGITPNGLRRVKKEVKQSKANEKRLSFIAGIINDRVKVKKTLDHVAAGGWQLAAGINSGWRLAAGARSKFDTALTILILILLITYISCTYKIIA